MNRTSIGFAWLLLFALGLSACSPVAQSGSNKGAETDDVDLPPDLPPIASGTEVYYHMASNEGYVKRSSDLKFENGNCFLSNLYDFPDDIFGDSSLDNLTTQALDKASCRQLAIAQSIKSAAGSCPATSLPLTAQDKTQISFDVTALATGLSAADYLAYATTVELTSDCVCQVNIQAPLGSLELKVPPGLAFCTQKFANYSDASVAAARAQILSLYGIQ